MVVLSSIDVEVVPGEAGICEIVCDSVAVLFAVTGAVVPDTAGICEVVCNCVVILPLAVPVPEGRPLGTMGRVNVSIYG